MSLRLCLLALVVGGLLSGCGTTMKEMHHHPQQTRLQGILATILPHTKYPEKHYWVRVSAPLKKHPAGLAIMGQRHIYVSEPIVKETDDVILTALIAHGVAHYRLHHHGRRSIINFLQRLAFKAGGFFVPGLSQGYRIGGPLAEVVLSTGQEPSADRKTVTYLTAMGSSAQDLRRALEFLVEHGYTERVGNIVIRDREFTNRINRLR